MWSKIKPNCTLSSSRWSYPLCDYKPNQIFWTFEPGPIWMWFIWIFGLAQSQKMCDITFCRNMFNLVCFYDGDSGEKWWCPCKGLGITGSSTNFQIHLSADWDPSRLPSNIGNRLQKVSTNQLCSSLSKRFHCIVTHLPHSNCLIIASARQKRSAQGDPHHSHPFPARKGRGLISTSHVSSNNPPVAIICADTEAGADLPHLDRLVPAAAHLRRHNVQQVVNNVSPHCVSILIKSGISIVTNWPYLYCSFVLMVMLTT